MRWDRGPRCSDPCGGSISPFRPGCGAVGRERETSTVSDFANFLFPSNRVFLKFFPVSAFEGALRGGQVGDFDGCMRMDGLWGWEVDWLSRPFPV